MVEVATAHAVHIAYIYSCGMTVPWPLTTIEGVVRFATNQQELWALRSYILDLFSLNTNATDSKFGEIQKPTKMDPKQDGSTCAIMKGLFFGCL